MPPHRRRQALQHEDGFSTLEALVAGALVAIAAIGVVGAFGAQQNAALRSTQDEMARDVSVSVDADASALASYSTAARDAIDGIGSVSATVTTPAGPAQVQLTGSVAQTSVAVRVVQGSARGEETVPLPNPRPTP